MTKLDKMLKETERYEIKNKKIPILMQKYPWIVEIAYKALSNNINLTMIEEPSDYIYFILGTIANESIYDMTDINRGNFLNTEKFFKLLEDYLIYIFDIKQLESEIRKKDIKSIQKNIVVNILKKLDIAGNFFVLLNIKPHNTRMSMKNISKILTYTNLLKN